MPSKSLSAAPRIWLFDVDGTLTPPRGVMPPALRHWFAEFASTRDVRLVTGGDRERIEYQLGPEVLGQVRAGYFCLGNSVWEGGEEVLRRVFQAPEGLQAMLEGLAAGSRFPALPANPAEQLVQRPFTWSLTVAGAHADEVTRHWYRLWDTAHRERAFHAEQIQRRYPGLAAVVSGDTSIDVHPLGRDKSQILPVLNGPVAFFADQTQPGGNDWTLATRLQERGCTAHAVLGPWHTQELLQHYLETAATGR